MSTFRLLTITATVATFVTSGFSQVYTPIPVQVQQLPPGATYPQVVSSNPVNGSINANAGNQNITVTFDQPMNVTTFYYNYTSYPNFPTVTQQPYWTNGNKTFVIPATLNRGITYQIPLNVYDQAFKSAVGVALPAGYITFTTGNTSGSSFSTGNTRFGGTTTGGTNGVPSSSPGSFGTANTAAQAGAARTGGNAMAVPTASASAQPLKVQNQGAAAKLPGQSAAPLGAAGQGVALPPKMSGAAPKNVRGKLATPTPSPQ